MTKSVDKIVITSYSIHYTKLYDIILLRGLGILLPDDIDVISQLSEQISVIKDSDIFPEREEDVINVIERVIRQACNMWHNESNVD